MSTVPERGNLTDALVYSYLKKRGFTDSAFAAAAAALPLQARTLAESTLQRSFPDMEQTVHNRITLFQGGCNHAASYTRLRDWVHGSLDLYKVRPHASRWLTRVA
jgi:lambda repressor-like predicted transcriptional regulator